jgi:hypothetical protein
MSGSFRAEVMELFDRPGVFDEGKMTVSAEYRKLLEECLHWADTAPSEQERTSFLQLAKTWYEAALKEEQSLGLVGESKELLERLRNYPGEQTASPRRSF